MQSEDSGSVPRQNLTFWQRHALTIIISVMAALFALVIFVQMKT